MKKIIVSVFLVSAAFAQTTGTYTVSKLKVKGDATVDGTLSVGTTNPTRLSAALGLAGPYNAPSTPVPVVNSVTIADYGASTRGVQWMSADRKKLFGGVQTTLQESVDDGVTWSTIKVFTATIYAVRELADGELLVSLYSDGSAPGKLWKSSGYARVGANATWTNVLTAGGANENFLHGWGLSVYKNIVTASEYGSKVSPNNAARVYLSQDHGATWTTILDKSAVDGIHIHGAAYDPYWNAIWVVHGDQIPADKTRQALLVSWDFGQNWTTVSTGASATQYVGIVPMEGCILLTTDGAPNGVHRIRRLANRTLGDIEVAVRLSESTDITHVGSPHYQAQGPNMPVLLPFINQNGPGLILATYDGWAFSTLWTDTVSYLLKGPQVVVGPTVSRKYVGMLLDDRQANLSRITLSAAPTNQVDGITAERDSAIATTLAGMGMAYPGWYIGPPYGASGAAELAQGYLYVVPMYAHKKMRWDRIGIEVTSAGSASSVVRLGIFASDAYGQPGARIVDAGTVDATGTGFKEATISVDVSPGIYWLAAIPQAASAAGPALRLSGLGSLPLSWISAAQLSTGIAGFYRTGETGAMPASYVAASATAAVPRILVRVAP